MKADRQATEAKRFKDPGSFVFPDGREWLEGEDWDNRRFELLQRSRGQCEYEKVHYWRGSEVHSRERCKRDAEDPHHIVLRSVQRDDRLSNLLAVCRPHHRLLDAEQRKAKRKKR